MAAVHGLKVAVIGGRTNSSGTAQDDYDQEEARLIWAVSRTQGRTPHLITQASNNNAFKVRQNTGSDMNVVVGSGTASADGYVLRGTSAGQGSYGVMLDDASVTVAVPAADGSLLKAYGVYLFVNDEAYSGSAGLAYASLICLAGTPHASAPQVPSASVSYAASALLWSFRLAAAATAVTNTILDDSNAADARTTSRALGVDPYETALYL